MVAETGIPQIAVPGRTLGPATKYLAGPGTYLYEGQVVASLMGKVKVTVPAKPPGPVKRLTKITAPAPEEPSTISVLRHEKKQEVLPDVGNVVLCKVVRLQPRQAIVAIQQVEATALQTEWQGVIRVQDVRATEKDKVKIYESFKPGDVVRAQVVSFLRPLGSILVILWRRLMTDGVLLLKISLGDQSNYYLSTASNELGVIMATSEAGNDMIPVSWKEYKDPETGLNELRKVAKPS
jgi:exosome complex component CSL4